MNARILVLLLLTPIAWIQAEVKTAAPSVVIMTDHADAIYKRGEAATFTVRLKAAPPDAEVTWTITKDGVPPVTKGKLQLKQGAGSVTGSLDEPGFLQCRVEYVAADKKATVGLAGAAFDPLAIKPGMPAPADFESYWAAEKEKLAKVPARPQLTAQPSPSKTIEVFDLQCDSIGKPVSGYFARPVGAKPRSLPVILTVHGAGVNSSGLTTATHWAAEGFLAMDMNAHGLPNGKPKEFYSGLAAGQLKDYRIRGRESRDTIYFHDMFLRLVRAIDVLTVQPEWDGKTVVVHGSSQGGFQSIVAAGLDSRVTFFAAGVPAGCDHTGFRAGRINGWPKFIGTGEQAPAGVIEAVRYYDAANFAACSKAAGMVTVGFIDATCPPSSVYAAYNSISGSHEIFNSINSGHTNTPAQTDAMRKAIAAHVASLKTK